MSHKLILSTHQPYAVEAMDLARQSEGWHPVYWMCHEDQQAALKARFGPDLITHPYLDAVKGRPAADLNTLQVRAFDPSAFAVGEEAIGIAMLDRNDSYSESMDYAERVAFLSDAVGYWTAVIAKTGATAAVFEEVPHQAMDYALYLAAKHAELLTIVPVRGLPHAGFLAGNQVGGTPVCVAEQAPSEGTGVRAGTGTREFIDQMKLSYDEHLNMILWDHSDDVRGIISKRRSLFSRFAALKNLKPTARLSAYINNFKSFRNDQKVAGKSLRTSEMTYLAFLRHKTRTLSRKSHLRSVYQEIAGPAPDLDTPFVYCCLQYQPEASTSPLAGRYVHQRLMVEQLAAALPEGWQLYVKEHPSQFSGEYARYGERFRSHDFYERVAALKNTRLVPLDIDSFTLIDKSRAVAGPGGSVCLEAVCRGKPALNFGQGFFVGAPSIFQITNAKVVEALLQKLPDMPAPDQDELAAYAQKIDQHTYPGAIGGPGQLERMQVSVQENARLHWLCWQATARTHPPTGPA